jgi:hypothetical protein
MPTYLFAYRSQKDFVLGTPETVAASGRFFSRIEPSLVDMGNPIFAHATVGECGPTTVLSGYSFVNADSLEEALALAGENWLLEHDRGVEVGEVTRLRVDGLATSTADHPAAKSAA